MKFVMKLINIKLMKKRPYIVKFVILFKCINFLHRFVFSFYSPLALSVNELAVEELLHVEELLDNVPAKTFVQPSHLTPLPKVEYTMKNISNIITKNLRSFSL